MHKLIGTLSDAPDLPAYRAHLFKKLSQRFNLLAQALRSSDFLVNDKFGVADAYLYTTLRWPKPMGISMESWPELLAFADRVSERPGVKRALKRERLLD